MERSSKAWLEIGKGIAVYMNRQAPRPSSQPIARLLVLLCTYEIAVRVHPTHDIPARGTSEYLEESPAALLAHEAEAILAVYPAVRSLVVEQGRGVQFQPLPAVQQDYQGKIETSVVQAICDLAAEGKINLLKRCACSKWFMASKRDRKHCSKNCRGKFHAQSEESKCYHRAKAGEAHQRIREPKLAKVRSQLLKWEKRKPRLSSEEDWKDATVRACPGITRRFLTTAISNGELTQPEWAI